jgi:cytochrome c oxidase subunit III
MQQTDIENPSQVTTISLDNNKLGVWTLLGSEAVFFSALIVTYIVNRGRSVTGPYPEILDVPLTALNTFILICSSLTMVNAFAAMQRGETRKARNWLFATMGLGLAFLTGQAIEFTSLYQHGLSLSSNLFGASFFTLTGFHGAHVLAGVIWIGFVVTRIFRGRVTQEHPIAVELVGLYWHFVDLVWILIFTIVYLI